MIANNENKNSILQLVTGQRVNRKDVDINCPFSLFPLSIFHVVVEKMNRYDNQSQINSENFVSDRMQYHQNSMR